MPAGFLLSKAWGKNAQTQEKLRHWELQQPQPDTTKQPQLLFPTAPLFLLSRNSKAINKNLIPVCLCFTLLKHVTFLELLCIWRSKLEHNKKGFKA